MKIRSSMVRRTTLVAAVCLSFSHVALASGSDSFSTTSNATGMYNAGKRVFAEKLNCDGCMFAGKSIDKDVAMKLISDPKATATLGADEKELVVAYAKRRFGL